jgi:hypothetical protein
MKPSRRKLLAALPLALAPAASDEAFHVALARLSAQDCSTGCVDEAAHETLCVAAKEMLDPVADGASPVPRAWLPRSAEAPL